MRTCRFLPPLLVLAVLPFAALAQSNDAAYCASLSALANRYIAGCATNGESKPDLQTRSAIDDCDKGNTAAGIPVLERKLRSNGLTLPKRS